MTHVSTSKLAALFGTFALVVPAAAVAAPTNEIELTYFNNASHDQIVGSRIITCSGSTYRQGKVTRYVERVVTPCNATTPLPEATNLPCEFLRAGCPKWPVPH